MVLKTPGLNYGLTLLHPLQFSISITLNISRSQFPSKTKVQICEHHHYTSLKHTWPFILQSFPTTEKVMAPHSSIPCLENPMDGGAWQAAVHGVTKTERLHFHFSLSCLGEGNGNPLQCSCLENPWDGGAWWAAVYGVAQSRTRLKRLSSSSSNTPYRKCSGN